MKYSFLLRVFLCALCDSVVNLFSESACIRGL
jgi:hypothetical protein